MESNVGCFLLCMLRISSMLFILDSIFGGKHLLVHFRGIKRLTFLLLLLLQKLFPVLEEVNKHLGPCNMQHTHTWNDGEKYITESLDKTKIKTKRETETESGDEDEDAKLPTTIGHNMNVLAVLKSSQVDGCTSSVVNLQITKNNHDCNSKRRLKKKTFQSNGHDFLC